MGKQRIPHILCKILPGMSRTGTAYKHGHTRQGRYRYNSQRQNPKMLPQIFISTPAQNLINGEAENLRSHRI